MHVQWHPNKPSGEIKSYWKLQKTVRGFLKKYEQSDLLV